MEFIPSTVPLREENRESMITSELDKRTYNMKDPTVIQIVVNNSNLNFDTGIEITSQMLDRIEKNLDIILNGNIAHDMRGRISSINISIAMLERSIQPESEQRFNMLKMQIEDLSRLIESFSR